MAESSGVNEAGKAWITISVKDEFTEGLEQASRALDGFSQTAEKATGAYNRALYEASRSSAEHWKRIADSCTQAGELMTAAWGKLSAPTKEAVDTYKNFDDMIRAASAKMAGATAEQLQGLYDQAKKLGAEMSFTATDVAEGMKLLAQNGFDASEVRDAIRPVMDLARATGTDVATAADIASTSLRSFNLDAGQMERVCDVLAATANTSAQSLTDIGYAIGFSATNAANAGSSLEDYMKLLGTLANFGQKGTKGGTALRKILTSSVSPRNSDKFLDLGISPVDINGNLKQTAELIGEVQQKIKDMGSGEQAQWLYSLFGSTGMTGGANLMKGSFEAMEAAIDNAGGTARRTADAMDAGLGGSLRMMQSAAESLQISIGEALAPALQDIYGVLKGIAAGAAEWVSSNKDLVAIFAEAGAAVTGLGFALTTTGGAILAAQKAAVLWGPTMSAFSIATRAAGLATSVLGKAFLFLEANPIVAMLTLVAAAAGIVGTKMYLASRESSRYSDEAEKVRKAHEAGMQADNAHLERLKELASKHELNNQEMLEASRLTAELNQRYNGLGLSLNTVTGKIEGLTEAQKKLAAAQQRIMLFDKKRELDEKKKLLDKTRKKNDKTGYTLDGKDLLYSNAEYTLDELQEMDRKQRVASHSQHGYDPNAVYRNEWTNVDRAVYNAETGKYRLIDRGHGEKARQKARAKLEKQMAEQNKLAAEVDSLASDVAALEAIRDQNEGRTPAQQPESPEPETKKETNETQGAAAEIQPNPRPAGGDHETTGAPANPQSVSVPMPAEEVPAELLERVDPFSAAGLTPADLAPPLQSGWDAAADLDAELARAEQAAANANETISGNEPATTAAADLAAAAQDLAALRDSEQQSAQQQGAEMQQSVADWKNGPGSASYQRMDITDKAIVDTAENTKITADYVKKLYDLLKANGGQAVFAQ